MLAGRSAGRPAGSRRALGPPHPSPSAGTPFHADRTEALNLALALILGGRELTADELAKLELAVWYFLHPHWEQKLKGDKPAIKKVILSDTHP